MPKLLNHGKCHNPIFVFFVLALISMMACKPSALSVDSAEQLAREAVAPNIIDAFAGATLTTGEHYAGTALTCTINGHSPDGLHFTIPATLLYCHGAATGLYQLCPDNATNLKNSIFENLAFQRTVRSFRKDSAHVKSWNFPGPTNRTSP